MVTAPARRRARLEAIGGKSPFLTADQRLYRRIRRWVIDVRDQGRCHLCLHWGGTGPASGMGIDHIVPRSECAVRGISPLDTSNMKAVHHGKPCRQCVEEAREAGHAWSGYCNSIRGAGSIERFRAKLLAAGVTLPAGTAWRGRPGAEADDDDEDRW